MLFYVLNHIISLGCWQNLGWKRRPWWPGWVLNLCFWPILAQRAHERPHHEPIRAPIAPRTPSVNFYYVAFWYWMLKPGLEGVSLWHILAPIRWICQR